MHAFTSITANYIPKARVLAESAKRHNPDLKFHLMLSDRIPDVLEAEREPFDSVITLEDFDIPDMRAWIFKHTVVELCTAVKGSAFRHIFSHHNADKVFYFDPDMVIFDSIEQLGRALDENDIILTPHQTSPEETDDAIRDNEISSLKHGVYNLGFLGLSNRGDGPRFLDWWEKRLLDYCYADIPNGLFTDQRWVDLAPAFFDRIGVLRNPEYNVATWNITHRTASGTLKDGILINERPLCFYHFSGFDSGAQEVMLDKYMGESKVLKPLREWYIKECERLGQKELGRLPCVYGFYDNGEKISNDQRLLYRSRLDVQRAFPDPFRTDDVNKSFYHWYKANVEGDGDELPAAANDVRALRESLERARSELATIKGSRSWRAIRFAARLRDAWRLRRLP